MKNKITSARLVKALSDANMTPAELSRRTNIGKSSISQYMSGYFVPKNDKAYLIAKELKVSPSWLMGLTDNMEETSDTDNNHSNKHIIDDLELASWMGTLINSDNEELYKLMKIISNLDEDKIKTLLVMAEALEK